MHIDTLQKNVYSLLPLDFLNSETEQETLLGGLDNCRIGVFQFCELTWRYIFQYEIGINCLQQQVSQLGYGEQITHLLPMKGAKNDAKRLTLLVGIGTG